jgi:hypothetical protein
MAAVSHNGYWQPRYLPDPYANCVIGASEFKWPIVPLPLR